jgi:iron complex outermembrane recepter protein
MSFHFLRSGVALAMASGLSPAVLSQSTPPAATLKEITVTGNPLDATDLIAPAAALTGANLLLRSQTTLGETLNRLPGVSSTYFGPNASRPIIRGLDGDRIRVLNNGGAGVDASSLSFDHAVPMDPIAVERVEVLRGPGALLYGGSAVGGVVNVIDNRIPTEPTGGFTGKADLGLATANRERSGAVLLEGGNQRFGLHVDAFKRNTGDVRTPVDLDCTQNGMTTTARRICNSASKVDGGAIGGSLFFADGYLGAGVSSYQNTYGTVAEDEVTIRMRSQRYSIKGEQRNLGAATGGLLQSVKGQVNYTDYRHTELDAGTPGTVFTNNGNDWRLEARHGKLGPLEGVIGLQGESTRFSADGDEAFAPFSRSRSKALFIYEELPTSWGKLSFGGRSESVTVESLGNPTVARFATGSRSFKPGSYAVGALWNLSNSFKLTGNLAHSQRAPKDYELFANGPHLATGAYEVGDAQLGKERSTQLDAGVQWQSGANRAAVTVFTSRFSNFISLESTGVSRDSEGNGAATGVADCGDGTSQESGCAAGMLPEFAYRAVRARFTGLEANGSFRLLAPAPGNTSALDLEWRAEFVRASNQTTGQPLPRIAPTRIGATLVWAQGPWGARLGFDTSSKQSRVPVGERATDGYTLVNAALTYRMKAGPTSLLWYAKLDNAGNQRAYSASSILTQTAPGKAPLPGRSLKLGLQASF